MSPLQLGFLSGRPPFPPPQSPTHTLFDPEGGVMAMRGVWQLQKLVVNYCDWGGSSRGISRAFMESHLPALKEKNPQLEVVTQLVRGQHPNLKGIYKNHNERVVCVRNLAPEDIMLQASRLRCSLGRKVVKLRTRHVTKRPSVQGTWTTELKM
uniref:Large ribosomal subunit protein mL43 n=3 Tax=Triticinae TaxID=1648030 RepID=A0A453IQ23_AEGTS